MTWLIVASRNLKRPPQRTSVPGKTSRNATPSPPRARVVPPAATCERAAHPPLRLVRPERHRPDQAAGRGVTAMTDEQRKELSRRVGETNKRSEERPR